MNKILNFPLQPAQRPSSKQKILNFQTVTHRNSRQRAFDKTVTLIFSEQNSELPSPTSPATKQQLKNPNFQTVTHLITAGRGHWTRQ
jgi:hypothetical protein